MKIQKKKARLSCQLYRHWDVNKNLLYVGVSKDALRRLSGHGARIWYLEIATITIEWFPTRKKALEAESKAIKSEKPRFNGRKLDRCSWPVSVRIESRNWKRLRDLQKKLPVPVGLSVLANSIVKLGLPLVRRAVGIKEGN